MKKYLILFTFLTACAPEAKQQVVTPGVDAAFVPFYQKFAQIYNVPQNMPIHFAALGQGSLGEIVGECQMWSDGERQILVDPGFWNSTTDDVREDLIFHELGHCVFNRVHVTTLYSDNCPTSIMYPYVFGNPCLATHESDYLSELPK